MKRYSMLAIVSALTAICLTGCGNNNKNASEGNNISMTETSVIETSESRKDNPDFNDLDDNSDGILDDSELRDDADNIGDGVVTVVEDVVTGAGDIVSDIFTAAEDMFDGNDTNATE